METAGDIFSYGLLVGESRRKRSNKIPDEWIVEEKGMKTGG